MSDVFSDRMRRELDFWEHHAGYHDPYGLFDLAQRRGPSLDQRSRQVLGEYAIAVTGVYEIVHFDLGPLVAIPDPWTTAG